jgi:hypothetical protein
MSKKTVTIKIPVKDAPRHDGAPSREEPMSPIAELAHREPVAAAQDEWVSSREADQPFAPPDPAPLFARAARSVTVDIAAERSFPEVAALTLMIPPMLGWFWLFNSVNRYLNRQG